MNVPWGNGEWRYVAVYGLGSSGRAATEFLARRGVRVLALDDGEPDAERLRHLAELEGVELRVGGELGEPPAQLDGLVLSPGVPPSRPWIERVRERGRPVIAEVELAFPFLEGPVIGITGSNGKSTTTALTGALLAASGLRVEICGNIGRPLVEVADGEPGRCFVVELSSFQLEAVRLFRPRAAALLNLSPDHLDRYPDLAAYRSAKEAIFAAQMESDTAVVNADDPEIRDLVVRARRRHFSRLQRVEDGCFVDGERVVEVAPDVAPAELFRLSDLAIPGVHNLENAMAAALLARAFEVAPETLQGALRSFTGLPHRLSLVRLRGGVSWYDDSKGTNPGATMRSLEGFADGSIHLIAGGRNKGLDLRVLAPAVERKARRLYLIGEASQELARALGDVVEAEECRTLPVAVARAAARARDGESVVLSPACASYDQYRDFVERGEHFQRLVAALPEEGPA